MRTASALDRAMAEEKARTEAPENWNLVVGPDSSQLLVRNDAGRHPYVYLRKRDSSERKLFNAIATSPSWAPNGRLVAAVLWRSTDRPWRLAIQDPASTKVLEAQVAANITEYEWSPDSRYIAGRGYSLDTKVAVLTLVRVSDGHGCILDSLKESSSYGFSWSPDSRYLAVTIPTRLTGHEDICAADLWIVSRDDQSKHRLLETPNSVETRPHWFQQTSIAVDTYACSEEGTGPDTTKAIDLLVKQ
jgi:dipeptidyl aminopeptidase/acylaminoacyl peptidase